MKYLYTNEPDEGCREFGPGVFGRPVHTDEERKLKSLGWKENIDGVRQKEERREEEGKVIHEEDLVKAYEATFGKKPHHKMKPETIREKLDEAYDE